MMQPKNHFIYLNLKNKKIIKNYFCKLDLISNPCPSSYGLAQKGFALHIGLQFNQKKS